MLSGTAFEDIAFPFPFLITSLVFSMTFIGRFGTKKRAPSRDDSALGIVRSSEKSNMVEYNAKGTWTGSNNGERRPPQERIWVISRVLQLSPPWSAMSLAAPHLPSPAATPDTPQNGLPPPAEVSQHDLLLTIEQKLLNLSQDLYELEICAGDVVEGQQQRIPDFLKRINEGLVELEAMSKGLTETVPRQVIE